MSDQPGGDRVGTALSIASAVSSAVPWIGGPVSNVLSGINFERKLRRVEEVLVGLTAELEDHQSPASEEYVQTEDFEELLERTLRQAAEERNEEKRGIYSNFLAGAIKSPGEEEYDEQMRFLRILEQLQPDHIRLMKALLEEPQQTGGIMGSPSQTLLRRLPDFNRALLDDLVEQLNDMRLTRMNSLHTMMTAHGAEDLRHSVTAVGRRFVDYL